MARVQHSKLTKRRPSVRRPSREAAPQILAAVAAAGGMALLARGLRFDEPTALDHRVRSFADTRVPREARTILRPLYPLGLPGGYITLAYGMAHWLHRTRRAGGPAIVTSAWMGWLVHRGAKLIFTRERPRRPGVRRRTDSYPSGHTTGATALALTTAYVLQRQGVVSKRGAAAIAIGVPVLMGSYRVIADDHWATDVFGGWLLGGAVGLTCNAVLADSVGGTAHRLMASAATRLRATAATA
ncbi:MAG: putative integral rane protein [Gemmatimonadetes bacterium]|nr:putative integral rane protein [Gemmatimonadota bacterium]